MKRFYSGLLASAFLLGALAGAPSIVSAHSSTHSSKMMKSCPSGQHWVKGYKTKSGKTVKGYCRK